jgi:hypothetical protein
MGIFSIYTAFGTVEYAKIFEFFRSGVDATGNQIGSSTWITIIIPLLFTIGAFGKCHGCGIECSACSRYASASCKICPYVFTHLSVWFL